MIIGRTGMAAIFDALVFIAVASVASTTLLTAFSDKMPEMGDEQELVENAHMVLLRSTVSGPNGNPYSVQELFLIADGVENGIAEHIPMALELLLPGWNWCWTVERGGKEVAVIVHGQAGADITLYCSITHVTYQGEQVEYRLEAWPT